jgi:putative heme-binding domain-containing protein
MTAEELASRHDLESEPLRLLCALALARQRSPEISAYLDDPAEVVRDEVARAIHDDAGIPEALPKLAALLDAERPLSDTVRRRVINANLRLGQPVNAARLLQFALRQEPSTALQALEALRVFSKPPRLDRVDGTAGSYPRLDDKALSPALIETWKADLLALADPALKAAVLDLFIQLEIDLEAPILQGFIADAKTDASLRAGALRLLAARHAATPAFAESVRVALGKAAPEKLRMEALTQLAAHRPEVVLAEFDTVLKTGSLKEKQKAFQLAASLAGPAADAWVEGWLKQLGDGSAEPGLRLDILEAAKERPGLAASLSSFQQTRKSAPAEDLLEGGDAERGRDLATNHLGANCIACHTIEAKEGSTVGPVLKGIGAQRSRAELLESLVSPAAAISPGYGLVSLTLKDGSSLAGTLTSEMADALELKLPDGQLRRVDVAAIAQKSPPMSVMPPMLGVLTTGEVRDVVAYLASLKTGTPKAPEKKPELAKATAKKAAAPASKAATPKAVAKAPAVKAPEPKPQPPASKPLAADPTRLAMPEPPRLEVPKPTPAKATAVRAATPPQTAPKAVTQPAGKPAAKPAVDPVTVITNAPLQPPPAAMANEIPQAVPVEDDKPKRGFSLRFGSRRKDEPAEAAAPAAMPAEAMPPAPATETVAEPNAAPAAPKAVKETAAEPKAAPAKETATAAPKAAPAKPESAKPELPKAIPVEEDAPMPAETPAKRGFFSRFRDKPKE